MTTTPREGDRVRAVVEGVYELGIGGPWIHTDEGRLIKADLSWTSLIVLPPQDANPVDPGLLGEIVREYAHACPHCPPDRPEWVVDLADVPEIVRRAVAAVCLSGHTIPDDVVERLTHALFRLAPGPFRHAPAAPVHALTAPHWKEAWRALFDHERAEWLEYGQGVLGQIGLSTPVDIAPEPWPLVDDRGVDIGLDGRPLDPKDGRCSNLPAVSCCDSGCLEHGWTETEESDDE